MRVLVIGAGALGGYFGARLIEAGRDVTFLVRPRRLAEMTDGLVVKSPAGDVTIARPQLVTADNLKTPFDLILLSCKAYDLNEAIASFAPAVGPTTAILPLLNGMAHLDALNERFGKARVLGGQCVISATLNAAGHVLHLAEMQSLTFGEQDGGQSERTRAVADILSGAKFGVLVSDMIMQDMWEKWVFITASAGMTCLMRGPIGDIVTAGGSDLAEALVEECAAIATRNGFAPRAVMLDRARSMVTTPGSLMTASMLRDIERGSRTEADHVLGDLIRRGGDSVGKMSMLRVAYIHLRAYEARRQRLREAPQS